jgi:hypothetical protein
MHLRSINFRVTKQIVLIILVFFIVLFYRWFILSQLIWLISIFKIAMINIICLKLNCRCNWSKTYIFFLLIASMLINVYLLILMVLILLTDSGLTLDIIYEIAFGMINLYNWFILIIYKILINSIYWLIWCLAVLWYIFQLI